ncbi:GNAT family N-acetyltransferase [Legionella sp. PC997]|uniref:GNAT family N-acetyltransferase n=1 Tax=Legionella sp. PC997 TaxID=2755562 RepID=UPI0015F901FD|nr:GNAT family N-acetyltransferase [Legionella sp. PC997]QMT62064.1 GNAT family acetyltransferase [Legionella sp. PC997]
MKTFLTTHRLIICEPSSNDFDNLYNLQSNSKVMKFIGNGRRNKKEARTGLEKAISHFQKHQFSLGSVYEIDSGQFIGRAGLIYFNYDDNQVNIELAYALLPEYWGKGYATELTKSLILWGFDNLSIQKLIAVVHPDNIASQKVLSKSGMINTSVIKYWDKEVLQFEIYKQKSDLN